MRGGRARLGAAHTALALLLPAAAANGQTPATPPTPAAQSAQSAPSASSAQAAGTATGLIDRLRGDVAQFLAYPHFDRGYRLLRDGRAADAVVEFELGLTKAPGEHRARLARADALHSLGRRAEALRELDRLAAAAEWAWPALQRRLAWHDAEHPIADAALDALIAHPQASAAERTQARRLRLARLVAAERWERARTDLEPLLAADPGIEDWLHAAQVAGALGHGAALQQALQRASALARSPAERITIVRLRADLARRAADVAAETAALADWQRLAPDHLDMLRARREAALRRRAWDEALPWAQRAARTAGSDWQDQRSLGHLLHRRGEAAAAARAFESALAAAGARIGGESASRPGAAPVAGTVVPPPVPAAELAALWRELGHALGAAGQSAEAAVAFEQAAALAGSLPAWRAAAAAWADAGRPARAQQLLGAQPATSRTAEDERRLAQWAGQLGEARVAAAHAEAAARRERSATAQLAAWREAAHWHTTAGDAAGAQRALRAWVALAPQDTPARLALADACLAQRDGACALAQLEAAATQAPSVEILRRRIDAHLAAADRAGAAAAWDELARWPGLPPQQAAQAHAERAELLRAAGQPDGAIAAYRAALQSGAAPLAVHEALAQLLLAKPQPAEALAALREAQTAAVAQNAADGTTSRLAAQVLRARAALVASGPPGAALGRDRRWDVESDEQIVLASLDQVGTDERIELLTLVASRRSTPGRWEDAERLWRELYRLRPDADHARHLAQAQVELGQTELALATLEPWLARTALAGDPHSRDQYARLLAQAGYAHFAARRDIDAARDFERALAADPAQWPWRSARAFALARGGRQAEARAELEQAIDQVLLAAPGLARPAWLDAAAAMTSRGASFAPPPAAPTLASASDPEASGPAAPSPAPAAAVPATAADLWQLREHNRALQRPAWTFSAYESVRSSGSRAAPASATPSGAVPSQGGVGWLWQPQRWELGPERPLQLTGRVFWSHRGSSLAIDDDTLQASLGLRAKPLARWPLFAEVQRLQGLGGAGGGDWLVRASAGWTQGIGSGTEGAAAASWAYSSIYADVGRYLSAGRDVGYLEGRYGRSWPLADDWVLSPYLLVVGRGEHPDPDRNSYAQWGAGISLRHAFGASRYLTPAGSVETHLQYRRGSDRAGSGWVFTVVLGL
jgi:Flp pilus assembly protein TadD